jgi:hypothetical protein
MKRPPAIIRLALRLHAAFERECVTPPEGHTCGTNFVEAADVRKWLTKGDAPRLVHLEVAYLNTATAPDQWRIWCKIGGRDLGRAVNTLWSANMDGTDLRDRNGRPIYQPDPEEQRAALRRRLGL